MSFQDYLAALIQTEQGRNLPERHVPSTMLWGFEEGTLVGRLMLRHHLNERLLQTGGNMGYEVVPAFQGRQVATQMLLQALPFAKTLGLPRVLLTCDQTNLASRRVIEKCGGVLEGSSRIPESGVLQWRFWILLR